MITFDHKPGPRDCYVAEADKRRRDIHGREFTVRETVRVIAESGGWRVDFTCNVGGAWLPWEPVTDTVFATLAEAQDAVRVYAAKPAWEDRR